MITNHCQAQPKLYRCIIMLAMINIEGVVMLTQYTILLENKTMIKFNATKIQLHNG